MNETMNTNVQLILEEEHRMEDVKGEMEAIISEELENIQNITGLIVDRKVTLF